MKLATPPPRIAAPPRLHVRTAVRAGALKKISDTAQSITQNMK